MSEKDVESRRFTLVVQWRERPGVVTGRPLTEEEVTFEVRVDWPALARYLAVKSLRHVTRVAATAGGAVTVRAVGKRGEAEEP